MPTAKQAHTAVVHEVIFLEPDCGGNERLWCENDQGPCDCGQPWVKYRRATPLTDAASDLLGALNFILAFYEPGQRHLDTEAWKQAEASARRAVKKATTP